jgi:tRNA nucleotidyltransferase/poly(A) polymerase
MVASGELDHLVPERVWQELAKGLLEARPSRMFDVLRECGALRATAARTGPPLRRTATRRDATRKSIPACMS